MKNLSLNHAHWGAGPICPVEKTVGQLQGIAITTVDHNLEKFSIQLTLPSRTQGSSSKNLPVSTRQRHHWVCS
jgi:hypothetical protein